MSPTQAIAKAADDLRCYEFFVPGPPVAKQRARTVTRSAHGPLPFARTYTPAKTENYQAFVRGCALVGIRAPIDGPITVWLEVRLAVPGSWSEKRKRRAHGGLIAATKRPDLDNVAKSILDAVNGLAWRDDAQIVGLHVTKEYAALPGVLVRIFESGAERAP